MAGVLSGCEGVLGGMVPLLFTLNAKSAEGEVKRLSCCSCCYSRHHPLSSPRPLGATVSNVVVSSRSLPHLKVFLITDGERDKLGLGGKGDGDV